MRVPGSTVGPGAARMREKMGLRFREGGQAATRSCVLFDCYKMTAATISPASHGLIQVINESNLCKIERCVSAGRHLRKFFLAAVQNLYTATIDFFPASSMIQRTGNPLKMPLIIIADCAGNDASACLSSTRKQVLLAISL